MRDPTLNDMTDMNPDTADSEDVFKIIKRCVHEIRDGETIYNRVDMSEKELEEFIDSLTGNQFEGLSDFNPKDKEGSSIKDDNSRENFKNHFRAENKDLSFRYFFVIALFLGFGLIFGYLLLLITYLYYMI